MDDRELRSVQLKRSESFGFGISVFGGSGLGLPPRHLRCGRQLTGGLQRSAVNADFPSRELGDPVQCMGVACAFGPFSIGGW
ncbi:hypothetical protein MRX96_007474 [Rhipicephalus microplus]